MLNEWISQTVKLVCVLNGEADCSRPPVLISALWYVLTGLSCKLTPLCCVSIFRAWAECPWMRSLKPPCMCMSRRFIVPISSSASTTSGSRISCAMWLSWWRARSSAGTGPCWLPAVSTSSRRWWARRKMAWSLASLKRYVHQTQRFPQVTF